MVKINRFRNWKIYTALFITAGCFLFSMAYIIYKSSEVTEEHVPLMLLIKSIQNETSKSHLKIEEMFLHQTYVDYETEILEPLINSKKLLNSVFVKMNIEEQQRIIRKGLRNKHLLDTIKRDLEQLIELTKQRRNYFLSKNIEGQIQSENLFNLKFNDFENLTVILSQYIQEDITRGSNKFLLTGRYLLFFSILATFCLGYVFHRFLKKREGYKDSIIEAKERLEITLKSIGDGMIATDIRGIITDMNPTASQLTGWRIEEAEGMQIEGVFNIVNQITGEKAVNPVLSVLRDGKKVGMAYNTTLISKTGERYNISDSASPIVLKNGDIIGVVMVFQNITEKYQIQEALKFERNQLISIFDSIDEMIYITDPLTYEVLYCNSSFKHVFGDVTGRKCYEAIHGLGKECDFCTNNRILDDKIGISHIWEYKNNINNRWYHCIDKIIRWADGRHVRYEMSIDITDRKIIEDSIKVSEEKYRLLFETMAQGVIYQDINGRIISANPAAERILGLTIDQLYGKHSVDPDWKTIHEDGSEYQGEQHPSMLSLKSGKPVMNAIMGVYNPVERKYVWIIVNAIPLFRKGEDKPYQCYTTFTDITERKQLEEALEKRIIALTQPMGETISIEFDELFDIKEIQAIQDAFANATGVASIITKTDGYPITEPSNFCTLCKDVIRKTEKGRLNCYYSDSVIGKYNPNGPTISPCLSGGLWDGGTSISVGNHHIANWLIGQIRDDTQNEDKMMDYCREIGADESEFRAALKDVKRMSQDEFKKVGEALFIIAQQLSKLAVQNIQQAREIAARKRAENELRESKRTLSTLMENLPGMVFRCFNDESWTMEFISEGCKQITGYLPSELIGNTVLSYNDIIHPDDRDYVKTEVYASLNRFETYQIVYRIITKDRKIKWVWEQGIGVLTESNKRIAIEGFITDISDRIEVQRQIAESEKKFRSIFENANDSIILLRNDVFIDCNPKTVEMFRCPKDAIVDKSIFEFSPEFQYGSIPSIHDGLDKINQALEDIPQFFEWIHLRADGEEFPVEVHLNKLQISNETLLLAIVRDITDRKRAEENLLRSEKRFHSLFEAMNEGVVLHDLIYDNSGNPVNYRIIDANPRFEETLGINRNDIISKTATEAYGVAEAPYLEYYADTVKTGINKEFETYFPPMDKHFFISVVCYEKDKFATIFFDISDRKKAEEIIRQQVEELEAKNAEMELFTYTVSHDLRSPLITIKGFLGMLTEDLRIGDMELLDKDMKRIANAADKMQNLLEDLLELSRIGRIVNPPKPVSMEILANEVIELLDAAIKEKNVNIIIAPEMPAIYADMPRLREALQNLIENSIKFLGNNPNPLIEIGYKTIDNKIQYFVKDNGIGIDPKYHEKIFGLFDKLNPATEGNGVGLALVKRIIEVHGGSIWAESEGLNKGTTFYFTLPNKKSKDKER